MPFFRHQVIYNWVSEKLKENKNKATIVPMSQRI